MLLLFILKMKNKMEESGEKVERTDDIDDEDIGLLLDDFICCLYI